jgi:hypothetical protein
MKRMLVLVGVSLLWSALAWAEPKTPDEWYKEGENQYNLGEFDKAAEAFKQGFSLETDDAKKPAFLYNVAQAYRQANKCKDAVFFYKRFLSMKDSGTGKALSDDKHKEIEGLINELDACARNQEALAKKPPENTMTPGSDNTTGKTPIPTAKTPPTTTTTGTKTGPKVGENTNEGDNNDDEEGSLHKGVTGGPKLVAARAELGGSKVTAGGLDVPIQPAFLLYGGYPIPVNAKLRVDVGLLFGLKPMPYTNSITNAKETGSMTQVFANAGGTYAVAPKISARADLGLGLLFFGGIQEMGNPFTQAGEATSGTLAMFAVRAAVSADYELTPNIVATVTPFGFTYSPAKSGLREDIKSITSIDFLIGVGYRM